MIHHLAKSTIMGIVTGYAGQAVGKFVVQTYHKDNKEFNPQWSDMAVATVVTLAVMASPVPMQSKAGAALTFGLGILGGVIGALRNKPQEKAETPTTLDTTNHTQQTQQDNTTQSTNNKATQQETTTTQNTQTHTTVDNSNNIEPTPQADLTSLPMTQLQSQLSNLKKTEKENYYKFIKEMSITDTKMYFNHSELGKFATQYYKIYHESTTSQQANLNTHTKDYINDAMKIANNKAYDNTITKQNGLLDDCHKQYIISLTNDSVVNRSQSLHEPLKTLLQNYLTLYQAKKISKPNT
jgi:hypothetical protein